jgi:hypothetical protein
VREEEAAEEGEEADEHPAEEARRAKKARDPGAPTRAEVEAHEATHLPFRIWCKECVAGRRDNPAHLRVPREPGGVPEVGFDYAFVRKDDEADTVTLLVMKDRDSRAVRVWVVPVKGVGADMAHAVQRAVEGVHDLGHRGAVVVKTDNEPALLALREAIMGQLHEGAIPVQPVPGESASNGAMENGVKLFKGVLRVHLAALEKKAGVLIPTDHPVIAWLVEHVADIMSKYLLGADGHSAYERLFGKPVREEGLEFGERVLYHKRHAQDRNVVLDGRWAPGLWLGRRWGTGTHRVLVDSKVIDVRAVQRVPAVERWSAGELAAIRATPWRTDPGPADNGAELVVLQPRPGPDDAAVPPAARPDIGVPRHVYIRKADLELHGYTASCRRCQRMRDGASGGGVAHIKECRERLERAMRASGDGRVAEAEARVAAGAEARARAGAAPAAAAAPAPAPVPAPVVAIWRLGESARAQEVAEEAYAADPLPARLPQSAPAGAIEAEWQAFPGQLAQRVAARVAARAAAAESAAAAPESTEAVVGVDAEEDRMIDFLAPSASDGERVQAAQLYELLLVSGATAAEGQAKVCELFSVPRVTKLLRPSMSLGRGLTFDLHGDADGRRWNFLLAADRREALACIRRQKPYIVIGSPPCTAFSRLNEGWNYKRMRPEEVHRRKVEGRVLLEFSVQVYRMQLAAGRHFLHEHPQSASSWHEPCMRDLRSARGVCEAVGDQCQFGLLSPGENGRPGLAKKPTRFLSSAGCVLQELGKRCAGDHAHVQLLHNRAAAAAVYPRRLCLAMLRGIAAQRRREGRDPFGVARARAAGTGLYELSAVEDAALGLHACRNPLPGTEVVPDPEQTRVGDETAMLQEYGGDRQYWDENTGEKLPPELVAASRGEELEFMAGWQVWDEVPISECLQRTGKKPIGTRWIDVNKGDRIRPEVRSRLVAQEIAHYRSDDFYAATPPLEALRMLLSEVASKRGSKLLVMDARKAHLHAMADRLVYVSLPPEARKAGMCARLRRCLYGTRDAPARWEAFLSAELRKMGFVQGLASPCCFEHRERDLLCVVHGDDFMFVGVAASLAWIEAEMHKPFLMKVVGTLGPDKGDQQEIRVLNRVIRWTATGITYEADPRHAEIIVAGLLGGSRPVSTPGAAKPAAEVDAARSPQSDEDDPLTGDEVGLFRSYAARANYLAMDRPDLAYPAKELCRRMKEPTKNDLVALRRIAQYLADSPRLVYTFVWQAPADLRVFTDTDFAGCRTSRRSTSGGCIMRGAHLLKHWSVTQKVITLSSGEAELAGVVRGASEGCGLQSLAADLGVGMKIGLHADSSAAIGICRRSGIGRVRHLAVSQLWVQERLRAGDFTLHKVPGDENPADILTKAVARTLLDRHLDRLCVLREAGRAASAPQVAAAVDQRLAASR